jgi:hypothetical protein
MSELEQPRMLSGLVTEDMLCFSTKLRGPVAQRLEQGTHNCLTAFCAVFRDVAQSVFQSESKAN